MSSGVGLVVEGDAALLGSICCMRLSWSEWSPELGDHSLTRRSMACSSSEPGGEV
jgi:hypothetical protein